ncbi:MAG: hypothetical protein LBR79_00060 [Oscillospiraceae bacterium]|nr:hypothetical protein [Oscillospiraceae bacterium]
MVLFTFFPPPSAGEKNKNITVLRRSADQLFLSSYFFPLDMVTVYSKNHLEM